MKNLKRIIILLLIGIILVIGAIIGIKFYLNSNSLTVSEKKWLDESKTTNRLINVSILNDAKVFGNNGEGVFYDFIDDLETEYNLNINKVSRSTFETVTDVSLSASNALNENDLIFYTDHYVVISKNAELINNINDLQGKIINVLANDISLVSSHLDNSLVTYITCEDFTDLEAKINENGGFAILPLHLYMDKIIKGNYFIPYHLSDINLYYKLSLANDEFSNILKKYYNKWQQNINESYYDNLFKEIVNDLGITATEIDAMRSITYKYGFINNSPYEIISSGNYGGIGAVYLKNFMDFADVEFNFTRYKNIRKFNKALYKDEIDIYFDYFDIVSDFYETTNGINGSYNVVANSKNNIVINSLNSLSNKTVYVDKYSYLNTYLSKQNLNINIKNYESPKQLLKLNSKDVIIIIDSNIYEYYKNHGLSNYTIRYEDEINHTYGFSVKNNNAIYRLLDTFVKITDPNTTSNEGIYNHEQTIASGRILGLIAKYFIYIVVIFLVVLLFVVKKTRKITIAKKIKKDDKLKFIDQLTLLKNRNYLHENIKEWNNNTIYPQAIIVIDLNKVHDINDVEGYEEGDKQIKAAANVLIKSQLDNSDIIRTDGNEFVVYMVGYSQKQITNYIHKINREFKKLPYNYGAEFGYSMILDDIKTIEDALNDATNSLKEQKELNEKKDSKILS